MHFPRLHWIACCTSKRYSHYRTNFVIWWIPRCLKNCFHVPAETMALLKSILPQPTDNLWAKQAEGTTSLLLARAGHIAPGVHRPDPQLCFLAQKEKPPELGICHQGKIPLVVSAWGTWSCDIMAAVAMWNLESRSCRNWEEAFERERDGNREKQQSPKKGERVEST